MVINMHPRFDCWVENIACTDNGQQFPIIESPCRMDVLPCITFSIVVIGISKCM